MCCCRCWCRTGSERGWGTEPVGERAWEATREVREAWEPTVGPTSVQLREHNHVAWRPSRRPGLRRPGEVAGRTWPSQRLRLEAVEDRFRIGMKPRQVAVPALPRVLRVGRLEAVQRGKVLQGLAVVEEQEPSGHPPGNSSEARWERQGQSGKEPRMRQEGEVAGAVRDGLGSPQGAPVRPSRAGCWEVQVRRGRAQARMEWGWRPRLVAEVDWLERCRRRRKPDRPRLEAWRRGGVQRRIYISRRKRKKF